MKEVFTVLTFGHLTMDDSKRSAFTEAVLKIVIKYYAKAVVIAEFGANASNWHLNVAGQLYSDMRTDNLSRIFRTIYGPGYKKTRNDVRSKRMLSETIVIGGYLQKEDSHQVLYNQGYDLEDLRKNAPPPKVEGVPTNQVVQKSNFRNLIIAYAKDNEMSLNSYEDLAKVKFSMIHSGYTFSSVKGCIYELDEELGIQMGFVSMNQYLCHQGLE